MNTENLERLILSYAEAVYCDDCPLYVDCHKRCLLPTEDNCIEFLHEFLEEVEE